MLKQKIEIELDVPDGFEATGEYRSPVTGESFITLDGCATQCEIAGIGSRFIIRKPWTPPFYLPKGTYVYWNGQSWWVSDAEPVYDAEDRTWMCRCGSKRLNLSGGILEFTPPETPGVYRV